MENKKKRMIGVSVLIIILILIISFFLNRDRITGVIISSNQKIDVNFEVLVMSNDENLILFDTNIIEQGEFSFNDVERKEGSLVVIIDDHQYVLLEYLDYLESLVIHLNYNESLDKVYIKASTDMQESKTIELVLNKK